MWKNVGYYNGKIGPLEEMTVPMGDRALYFDPRKGPFPQVESEDALLELLSRFDQIPADGEAMIRFFGATETGRASEQAARWISERIPR